MCVLQDVHDGGMLLMAFSGMSLGHIDQMDGTSITGWMYSAISDSRPVVLVDERPAFVEAWPLPRADVQARYGIEEATGFRCKASFLSPDSTIRLYAVSCDGAALLDEKKLPAHVCETNIFLQLRTAAKIAALDNAVAVVCWEGSHNPLGRAKVLYDVVASKRPAVLFTYLFDAFGGELWPPVARSETAVVTIPWNRRELFHHLIAEAGIRFHTIWLCKPRVPTFLLGALLAAPDARCIVDIDDNETAFSRNETLKNTVHGLAGVNLAEYFLEHLGTRTVASRTLQEKYGGHLVRHARKQCTGKVARKQDAPIKIGFIGTARSHKNLRAAAKSIALANRLTRTNGVLHVYGDIDDKLRLELQAAQAVVHGGVALEELADRLREIDMVLTGFPSTDPEYNAIIDYQISSKISDALSAGIPVLVPDAPSVRDLGSVNGLFPFTANTFLEQYLKALSCTAPITLPHEFTFSGAYEHFLQAEQEAIPGGMERLAIPKLETASVRMSSCRTLVLLWKQHDAGIYGRRVDQIARSWKQRHPEDRVIILECMNPQRKVSYQEAESSFFADARLILSLAEQKSKEGYLSVDGVLYKMLDIARPEELHSQFLHFLVQQDILPQNTCFVLFPIVNGIEQIQTVLVPYKKIVDVVDNQTVWASTNEAQLHMLAQYKELIQSATVTVFNSENNRTIFLEKGLLSSQANYSRIANWYRLPCGVCSLPLAPLAESVLHLVYSGNMNDRIDWGLLHAICALPQTTLHLIGVCSRRQDDLFALLKHPAAVYHGALDELRTLELVRRMDAAIVPHEDNYCSMFMNPMKIHMYAALGIPVLCAAIAGVESRENLTVCKDTKALLHEIDRIRRNMNRLRRSKRRAVAAASAGNDEDAYMRLIEQCFATVLQDR